jgi:hypothetical protein
MIQIDGKIVDLTKPETWGNNIKIKPNGFIEQTKNGVTNRIDYQTITSLKERNTTLESK